MRIISACPLWRRLLDLRTTFRKLTRLVRSLIRFLTGTQSRETRRTLATLRGMVWQHDYLLRAYEDLLQAYPKTNALWVEHYGTTVQDGPFTGMTMKSPLTPYLVGSFEAELYPVIEETLTRDYTQLINIGCAEGYYAVGYARRNPALTVHAFDTTSENQAATTEMARTNGVESRVIVGGHCDVDTLRPLLQSKNPSKTLIFIDCEGCELDLLDPTRLPVLRQTDVLVEVHDFVNPIISSTLQQRFRRSHRIRVISATSRHPSQYAQLAALPDPYQRLAIDERRPAGMQWYYMTVKATA